MTILKETSSLMHNYYASTLIPFYAATSIPRRTSGKRLFPALWALPR